MDETNTSNDKRPDFSHNVDDVTEREARESRMAHERERIARLNAAIEATKKAVGAGDLYCFTADDVDILFVRPNKHQLRECFGRSADNKKAAPDALVMLARQVAKWPDPVALSALFDEWPGIPMDLANDAIVISSKKTPDSSRKV